MRLRARNPLVATLLVACHSPSFTPCTVSCSGGDRACPPGLWCGTDGFCHAAIDDCVPSNEPQPCSASDECTAPPPAICVSDTTVRQYTSTGTCTAEACSYDYTETVCSGGCENGACVCKSPSWAITTADSSGTTGMSPSLAVDSAGGQHVAYWYATGADLRHAYRPPGGSWTTTPVVTSGDVGYLPSLAIDSANNLHVAYIRYEPTTFTFDLWYARRGSGGSWMAELAGQYGPRGYRPSLVVDGAGTVYVAYAKHNGPVNDFVVKKPPQGAWIDSAVLDAGGDSPAIAVDPSGGIHMIYSYWENANVDLRYAHAVSSVFSDAETVDLGGHQGTHSAIARMPSGELHASYHDASANRDLRYAQRSVGGAWHSTAIDSPGDVGIYTSLAVDAGEGVYVSYMAYNGDVKLAYKPAGGGWMISVIDSVGAIGDGSGGGTSIAVDAAGGVRVAYYDFAHADLKVAERVCLP